MGVSRRLSAIVAIFLWSCPLAWGAEHAASPWSQNDQGAVRLISAVSATGDSGRVQLGLEFHLKPGWKIYWRSPGDAGFPPSVDWKGSDNLADAMMSWPAPHRFSVSGLETMGYKDEVVLPIVLRLSDPAQPLSLKAAVDYLTCDVLCVPGHADLSLDLPAGAADASAEAHLIGRFLSQVPSDGALQGLSLVKVQATDGGGLKVVVSANPPLVNPDLFIERADQMMFGRPRVRLQQGGKRVVFETFPVPKTGEGDIFDKPLTLTVVDGGRGMEEVSDVAPAEPGSRLSRMIGMLGVAFLGGLILNLMPCVLPVLSLKVLGLIGHAGAERRVVRAGFLASAAGILVSFLGLAAAAAAVRQAGAAVGWGIQFQQPLFLVSMVVLVTLFAANLFGFFEIPLPRWAADRGRGKGEAGGLAGHFASGAFATLLATPCSAPFLGTAVGFALSRGPFEIFSIFLVLGLGMSTPYLAVAVWPAMAQRLPKPGRWMLVLRRILGLVLLGTAGWLLSVLAAEAGLRGGGLVAALILTVLLVLGLGRRLPSPVRGAAVLLLGGAALASVAAGPTSRPLQAQPAELSGIWTPFTKEAVAKSVADGKVVFVDVTAEWCITCQVNKAAVVYRGKVAETLRASDVVAYEADWTRPDEAITTYLASFGRYGIPFNVVYGPGAPDGIVLPELLTEEAVLDALAKARKPS